MKQIPKDSLRSMNRKIFISTMIAVAITMILCVVQYWHFNNEKKVMAISNEITAILTQITEKLVDQKNSKKSLLKPLHKISKLLTQAESLLSDQELSMARGKLTELVTSLERMPEAVFTNKLGARKSSEIRYQVYRVMEMFRDLASRYRQYKSSNTLIFLVVLEFLLVLIALGCWSFSFIFGRILLSGVEDATRYIISIDQHQKVLEPPKALYLELHQLIGFTKEVADKLLASRNEAAIRANNAENIMQTKSNFFVSLSHQIRTPLNSVIGFTAFLAESPLNEEQKGWLQNIRDSSDMLAALTKDTLDLAKIEATKIRVERHEFDLKAAITRSLAMVQHLATSRSVAIETVMINRPPTRIVSDSMRLEQVLANLMSNGVKFSNEGGKIELSIELLRMIDKTTCCLRFSIKDHGSGIGKEFHESIFEPFSNLESLSVEPTAVGTGLGLALSRKIVRGMGGDLTLESEYGKGSIFSFEMIVGVGDEQAPLVQEIPAVTSSKAAVAGVVAKIPTIEQTKPPIQTQAQAPVAATSISSPPVAGSTVVWGQTKASPAAAAAQAPSSGLSATPITAISGPATNPVSVAKTPVSPGLTVELESNKEKPPQSAAPVVSSIFGQSTATVTAVDPLLPPLRILLVEDNLINQKILQKILKNIGYDCVIANNGLEATEFCSKLEFDIIFMDLKMPKKDGLTAAREILQMPNNKKSIVIAVTANAFEEEKALCISAGMAAYVLKPVSLQAIETEMFRQLAKQGITKG